MTDRGKMAMDGVREITAELRQDAYETLGRHQHTQQRTSRIAYLVLVLGAALSLICGLIILACIERSLNARASAQADLKRSENELREQKNTLEFQNTEIVKWRPGCQQTMPCPGSSDSYPKSQNPTLRGTQQDQVQTQYESAARWIKT